MSRSVYILNGPNLNLLGTRQPEVYGRETLADVEHDCRAVAKTLNLEVSFHQSNLEGALIETIHDALKILDVPIIEVHISNVHQREEFRHHSFISRVASGVIVGCGTQGYQLALHRLAHLLNQAKK